MVTLLEKHDGGFNLYNYITFSCADISSKHAELAVNGKWKNGFIPIGFYEEEKFYLILDTAEGLAFFGNYKKVERW